MLPSKRWLPVVPLLMVWGWGLAADVAPHALRVEIAAELERLSAEYGFEVRGIEQTQDVTARSEGDTLLERLHLLLEDFDHVIVQTPDAGIERVIILGEKAAYVPPQQVSVGAPGESAESDGSTPASGDEIVLPTQRKGASHIVIIAVEGPSKQQIQQSMLIDTGADRVVLPLSLLASLGMPTSALKDQQVQTANGSVDAQIGQLSAVWLGGKRVENVDAAFIDDQRLGGVSLLGMSLLSRFRMTIDDEHNQLTLVAR